eukprot:gene580-627_t
MLEELLILHADVSEAASRKNELWDRLCRDTSDVFFKHWYRTLLMSPRKRSILLKLLAVRAFMGRRERFINGKIVFDHVIDMRRLSDMKNGKSNYSLESVPVDLGGTSREAEFKDDAEWKLLEAQIPQMIVQSDDMLKCKPWDITDTDVFSKLRFLNTFWNRVLDVHGRVTVQRNKPTVQVWEGYSKEFGGALLLLEGENRSVDGGGEKLHGDREGVEDDGRRVDDGAMEGMRKAMLRASIINHLGGSIYSESSESLAGLSESASRRVTIVQSTPLFYLPRPSHSEVPSPVSSRRESGSGGNLTGLEYALKNYDEEEAGELISFPSILAQPVHLPDPVPARPPEQEGSSGTSASEEGKSDRASSKDSGRSRRSKSGRNTHRRLDRRLDDGEKGMGKTEEELAREELVDRALSLNPSEDSILSAGSESYEIPLPLVAPRPSVVLERQVSSVLPQYFRERTRSELSDTGGDTSGGEGSGMIRIMERGNASPALERTDTWFDDQFMEGDEENGLDF